MPTPAPYIAKSTIAACVLNENGIDFLNMDSGLYCSPKALYVPCKVSDLKYDNYDRWAVPISDNGIFTGFDYSILRTGDYILNPPTVDSLPCFLIKETRQSKYWYIYGELTDLIAAGAVDDGGTPILMQGIVEIQDPFNSPRDIFAVDPAIFPKIIIPQYSVNLVNNSSVPYAIFSLPTLGGKKYFPQGIFNRMVMVGSIDCIFVKTTCFQIVILTFVCIFLYNQCSVSHENFITYYSIITTIIYWCWNTFFF